VVLRHRQKVVDGRDVIHCFCQYPDLKDWKIILIIIWLGDYFTHLGSFLKNIHKSSPNFWLFFPKVIYYFDKNGLGHILCNFFTDLSLKTLMYSPRVYLGW
jgi:hypothetical protein